MSSATVDTVIEMQKMEGENENNSSVDEPNTHLRVKGGFQLEFVSINLVLNHMTCYNSSALSGGKFIPKRRSFKIFALQSECCNFNQ